MAALARALLALSALLCLSLPGRAQEADEHAAHHHGASDVLLFASAQATRFSPRSPSSDLNEDARFAGDVVFTLGQGGLRLFGELLLSGEEHDLERLQLGYELGANTVAWLGRFHQPASAWNLEHHHGRYLQTAITRPAVELWEDERGVLPQHVTGLLLESTQEIGDGQGVQFALGGGLGVTLGADGLQPVDLLDFERRGHRSSWSGRVSFLPEQLGGTQWGVVVAEHRTRVTDAGLSAALGADKVRQTLVGAFADWRSAPWRVLGVVYDVQVRLDAGASSRRERFEIGYLQVERQLMPRLTGYARAEDHAGVSRSDYVVRTSPNFEVRRNVLGLRWDWLRHQALTVEVARGRTLQVQQSEARLQWSAVFP